MDELVERDDLALELALALDLSRQLALELLEKVVLLLALLRQPLVVLVQLLDCELELLDVLFGLLAGLCGRRSGVYLGL